MSKARELLNYKWQKNYNEFIFSVTLLLALFAVRGEFSGKTLLIVYFIFPILIFLGGYGLIKLTISEKEYLESLRDKRKKISRWEQIKSWVLIGLAIVIGSGMVYVAMNIWKEFFISTYS